MCYMLIVYSLQQEYKPTESREFSCLVPMYPVWNRVGTLDHSLSDQVITYPRAPSHLFPFHRLLILFLNINVIEATHSLEVIFIIFHFHHPFSPQFLVLHITIYIYFCFYPFAFQNSQLENFNIISQLPSMPLVQSILH